MERYNKRFIIKDLSKKMVFLAGPRQVGKTTLAQQLLAEQANTPSGGQRYFNWDDVADREILLGKTLPFLPGLVVLDEIHKYCHWRTLLKGLYDKRKSELQILVTGSARLDYYRQGGDSLQGRYHLHRLHPLSYAELSGHTPADLEALFIFGGFPEPFLAQSETETRRWSREYRSRVLRDDLRDLEQINNISLLEQMSLRLPELVGSPLSLNALREDLQVSHQTIVRWMNILEQLYSVFRIYPFGSPKVRAVKKEAKHYHFDWTQIKDQAARFENLVACHLLKWCHFLEDTEGWEMELRYFRDTDKREVDFVLLQEGKPTFFIECKLSAKEPSPHLRYLSKKFTKVQAVQVHLYGHDDLKTAEGIRMVPAHVFLRDFV